MSKRIYSMDASAENKTSGDEYSVERNIKRGVMGSIISFFGLKLRPPGGKREKFLAIFSAIIIFCVGSVSNIGMTKSYDFLFPDAAQKTAKAIQDNIQNKVSNIESISKSITNQISGIDVKLSEKLNSDIFLLKTAVASLQPDIANVGIIGGEAVRLFTEAKQNDIKNRNFSVLSDFVVPSGQGATVCPDRYVFSMREAVGTSVEGALSGGGEQTRSALSPGSSVYLKNKEGKVIQVSYQSKYGEGKSATYGFSVFCE